MKSLASLSHVVMVCAFFALGYVCVLFSFNSYKAFHSRVHAYISCLFLASSLSYWLVDHVQQWRQPVRACGVLY
jgi:hypothetical protein